MINVKVHSQLIVETAYSWTQCNYSLSLTLHFSVSISVAIYGSFARSPNWHFQLAIAIAGAKGKGATLSKGQYICIKLSFSLSNSEIGPFQTHNSQHPRTWLAFPSITAFTASERAFCDFPQQPQRKLISICSPSSNCFRIIKVGLQYNVWHIILTVRLINSQM